MQQTKKIKNPVKIEANNLLVIAITGVVALALNLLAIILLNVGNAQAAEAVNYAGLPASVAQIVFIILNFTKWTVVRDKTKIDYHCVTVGYIVPMAVTIGMSIVVLATKSVIALTVVQAIAMVIDLYIIIYSFILQDKVRAYAK